MSIENTQFLYPMGNIIDFYYLFEHMYMCV